MGADVVVIGSMVGAKRLGARADIAGDAAFLHGPEPTLLTHTDPLVDGGVIAALRSGALAKPSA